MCVCQCVCARVCVCVHVCVCAHLCILSKAQILKVARCKSNQASSFFWSKTAVLTAHGKHFQPPQSCHTDTNTWFTVIQTELHSYFSTNIYMQFKKYIHHPAVSQTPLKTTCNKTVYKKKSLNFQWSFSTLFVLQWSTMLLGSRKINKYCTPYKYWTWLRVDYKWMKHTAC